MPSVPHRSQTPPRRSWRLILLLCGWCLGTGVQWDALQAAAWVRMWLVNVQTESLPDAFATTFSTEGMCRVCHTVQAVKQAQRDDERPITAAGEKAPLLPARLSRTTFSLPTRESSLVHGAVIAPAAVFREPPVPPPRAGWV